MKVRKPLFIIESKYDRADRERAEAKQTRNAIFFVLALAGGAIVFSQCNSNSNNDHRRPLPTYNVDLD